MGPVKNRIRYLLLGCWFLCCRLLGRFFAYRLLGLVCLLGSSLFHCFFAEDSLAFLPEGFFTFLAFFGLSSSLASLRDPFTGTNFLAANIFLMASLTWTLALSASEIFLFSEAGSCYNDHRRQTISSA
ncbi:unnamed protein product [Meganyctiphanes norvegica]|uniref:Uncharacterized protein n=1 Tax=Meganyctiphanes norvegica TaxID=48144 RepID=A0AAV2PL38_MEGNR